MAREIKKNYFKLCDGIIRYGSIEKTARYDYFGELIEALMQHNDSIRIRMHVE